MYTKMTPKQTGSRLYCDQPIGESQVNVLLGLTIDAHRKECLTSFAQNIVISLESFFKKFACKSRGTNTADFYELQRKRAFLFLKNQQRQR